MGGKKPINHDPTRGHCRSKRIGHSFNIIDDPNKKLSNEYSLFSSAWMFGSNLSDDHEAHTNRTNIEESSQLPNIMLPVESESNQNEKIIYSEHAQNIKSSSTFDSSPITTDDENEDRERDLISQKSSPILKPYPYPFHPQFQHHHNPYHPQFQHHSPSGQKSSSSSIIRQSNHLQSASPQQKSYEYLEGQMKLHMCSLIQDFDQKLKEKDFQIQSLVTKLDSMTECVKIMECKIETVLSSLNQQNQAASPSLTRARSHSLIGMMNASLCMTPVNHNAAAISPVTSYAHLGPPPAIKSNSPIGVNTVNANNTNASTSTSDLLLKDSVSLPISSSHLSTHLSKANSSAAIGINNLHDSIAISNRAPTASATATSTAASAAGANNCTPSNATNTTNALNITKLQERLSTLEGRQGTLQSKISQLDRVFGGLTANHWRKGADKLKDLLYGNIISSSSDASGGCKDVSVMLDDVQAVTSECSEARVSQQHTTAASSGGLSGGKHCPSDDSAYFVGSDACVSGVVTCAASCECAGECECESSTVKGTPLSTLTTDTASTATAVAGCSDHSTSANTDNAIEHASAVRPSEKKSTRPPTTSTATSAAVCMDDPIANDSKGGSSSKTKKKSKGAASVASASARNQQVASHMHTLSQQQQQQQQQSHLNNRMSSPPLPPQQQQYGMSMYNPACAMMSDGSGAQSAAAAPAMMMMCSAPAAAGGMNYDMGNNMYIYPGYTGAVSLQHMGQHMTPYITEQQAATAAALAEYQASIAMNNYNYHHQQQQQQQQQQQYTTVYHQQQPHHQQQE